MLSAVSLSKNNLSDFCLHEPLPHPMWTESSKNEERIGEEKEGKGDKEKEKQSKNL